MLPSKHYHSFYKGFKQGDLDRQLQKYVPKTAILFILSPPWYVLQTEMVPKPYNVAFLALENIE